MDVSAIGSREVTVRLNNAEQARQMADARQTAILQDQGVSVNTPSPPVMSNPTFSPALYAQAAQYQLYSQSGVLASLVQQHHNVSDVKPMVEEPDAVTPVEEAHGGTVDTLA